MRRLSFSQNLSKAALAPLVVRPGAAGCDPERSRRLVQREIVPEHQSQHLPLALGKPAQRGPQGPGSLARFEPGLLNGGLGVAGRRMPREQGKDLPCEDVAAPSLLRRLADD